VTRRLKANQRATLRLNLGKRLAATIRRSLAHHRRVTAKLVVSTTSARKTVRVARTVRLVR
jgi:hypothetical protein